MTAIKRPLEEVNQGLSKTERRRLAKKAKKEKQGKGGGGSRAGGTPGRGKDGGATPSRAAQKKGPKPKMTKEERRAKYTQKAYEARERQNQLGPGANNTRCLGCRVWGHIVANCPQAKTTTGICFNCGSSKHALRACPKPKQEDGSLPHATCFVCNGKGHISAQCKQNANGIYPKGGFCKGCGSKHHLSWDCPHSPKVDKKLKKNEASNEVEVDGVNGTLGGGGGGGAGGEAARSGGGALAAAAAAAAGGGAVAVAVGVTEKSRAKNPKDGRSGSSRARAKGGSNTLGSNETPAPALPGGDDLEDDGYYHPDDAPEAQRVEVGHDAEDRHEMGGGPGSSRKGAGATAAKKRKSSKVVVF